MADEKGSKWQCYIIPDLATWTGAAGSKPCTPIEFYDTYEQGAMEPKDVTFSRWKHPLKPSLRKSVLKELRESHSKEAAGKLPRKHKEKGWSERSD